MTLNASLTILTATAGAIGLIHTLAGPDHYLPFVAMSRAGRWTLRKTLIVTALCGIGHVLGSVLLGIVGIFVGWSIAGVEAWEGLRGDVAAWLLLGFGLAYTVWGLRRAILNRAHTHLHVHEDGTVHAHQHTHVGAHAHVHAGERPRAHHVDAARPPAHPDEHAHAHDGPPSARRITPWILFTIFVFGPCEPLIPLLMYPAAEMSLWGVVLVTSVFGVATIATMLTVVLAAHVGLRAVPTPGLERYSHLAAGLAVTACAAAMMTGL